MSGYGGCETTGGTVNLLKKQVRVVLILPKSPRALPFPKLMCILTFSHFASRQQQQQLVQPQLSTGHIAPASGDNYSYVQLTAVHEPVKSLHEHRPEPIQSDFDCEPFNLIRSEEKRESCASIKKPFSTDATAQPHKELVHTKRVRCRYTCSKYNICILYRHRTSLLNFISILFQFRYCQEFFTEEFNRNGACEFAPDRFKASLEYTTAMKCARCMLYHCMSDSEGEMPQHPCECVPEESVCSKR